MCGHDSPLGDELRRQGADLEAKKILHLAREDDDGYSAGESHNYRMRNEFDRCAQSGDAECDQNDAGHQRSDDQPVDAEALNYPVDDYNECTGRSADLNS